MKIVKINENLLKEADGQVDDIEVADSVSEIADEIQDQSEIAKAPMSDDQAQETAEIAKEIGDKTDAENIAVIPTKEAPLQIKNKLTETLDLALRSAKYFKKNHINERANVLVCGLPGSSKTASVYN